MRTISERQSWRWHNLNAVVECTRPGSVTRKGGGAGVAEPFDLLKTDARVSEVEVWFRGERTTQIRVRRTPQGYGWGLTRPGTTQHIPQGDGFPTPRVF